MRKPMRTIAAAITLGIMSATAATGINYPTSIEAKAAGYSCLATPRLSRRHIADGLAITGLVKRALSMNCSTIPC